MADLIDWWTLKNLIPPNTLKSEHFRELASKTFVEHVPAGRQLFKVGDFDKTKVYVLEGEVELTSVGGETFTIQGGTELARNPLDNHIPRKYSAKTKTPCDITRINADLLDVLLTWDQLAGIEVDEIQTGQSHDDKEENLDWMTRILQSKAFHKVPAANIQAIFMRMTEMPVEKGQVIIKQDEEGDCYYLIQQGECKVTRSSGQGNTELTLATLRAGDAFGEEALLSDAKRNATVTMTKNGVLMRLSKDDFNSLLKEPMLNWVDYRQAEDMVSQGAVWLDVRLDSEFKESNLPGSINMPLFTMRIKAEKLDPNKKYILYCDTGRRSSAAAFLLSERGIQAYCVKGGLQAVSD